MRQTEEYPGINFKRVFAQQGGNGDIHISFKEIMLCLKLSK